MEFRGMRAALLFAAFTVPLAAQQVGLLVAPFDGPGNVRLPDLDGIGLALYTRV